MSAFFVCLQFIIHVPFLFSSKFLSILSSSLIISCFAYLYRSVSLAIAFSMLNSFPFPLIVVLLLLLLLVKNTNGGSGGITRLKHSVSPRPLTRPAPNDLQGRSASQKFTSEVLMSYQFFLVNIILSSLVLILLFHPPLF